MLQTGSKQRPEGYEELRDGQLSGGIWCEQDWGCGWRALWVLSRKSFVVQSLSHVHLFVTPWTAAHQASVSFAISWSLLRFMSIESVMASNHFIFCRCLHL